MNTNHLFKRNLLYTAVMFINISNIIGQTADTSDSKRYRFDISGGFYQQKSLLGEGASEDIMVPDYLYHARPQEPEVAQMWGLQDHKVTDSPLFHGGSYFQFHSWYRVNNDLELYGSLTVDHRGFSFAPYNTEQVAFLPRYYAKYNHTATIGNGNTLTLYGKLGTFENYKNYEGLMLYNIDMQGVEGGVQWNKLRFQYTQVGDLQFGIGLGLDGLADYQLSLQDLPIHQNWNVTLQLGAQDFIENTSVSKKPDIISIAANIHNNRTKFYTEAGYRLNAYNFEPQLNLAFLAGMSHQIENQRIALKASLEYRHYGGGFNYSMRNETNTHYRKTDQSQGGNYIGDNVYPLSFMDRPFSQWAVFTEYDKQWVNGLTLFSNFRYKFTRHINGLLDLDFNYILAEGEEGFLYPFYKAGLELVAVADTAVRVSITNKTMNLDKHYTTYYLTKSPALQLELRRDIK